MEAPIPASALIHSATLVSAGIFFFFKFKLILMSNIFIISIFSLLNSLTILYGSIVAFFQTDLKKILAYSTIGNCGLMFLAAQFLTINEFLFIFYLHGTSKALSFLFCGFIINLNYHNQDIRLLGGLNLINYSYIFNIIFSLSMLAA